MDELNRLVDEELEAELSSGTYYMKQEYSKDEYYDGSWDVETDLYHGFGKLKLPDESYVGFWKLGKYHGPNKDSVLRKHNLYYKGGFFEGQYNGKKCILRTPRIKYRGGFHKGLYQGRECSLVEEKEDNTVVEYEGGMSGGMFNRRGTLKITNENGQTQHYEGDFHEGKYSGKGKLSMYDGTRYEGGFKVGEFNGYGSLTTHNYVYKGYWRNGAIHGKGCAKWLSNSKNDKTKANGTFKNGILHGENCIVNYRDGSKYVGAFKYGLFTGFGKFFDSQRRLIYEGEYLNNQYDGEGVQYRLDGTVRYIGSWKDGKKHGSGKYIRKDGSLQYDGTSTNDRMTGKGTYFFPSGATYVGEVVEQQAHGFGTMTDKFGNIFCGWFVNGKRFRAYVKPKTPRCGSTKKTAPPLHTATTIKGGASVGIKDTRNAQGAGAISTAAVNNAGGRLISDRPQTAYSTLPKINSSNFYRSGAKHFRSNVSRPTSSMNWSR